MDEQDEPGANLSPLSQAILLGTGAERYEWAVCPEPLSTDGAALDALDGRNRLVYNLPDHDFEENVSALEDIPEFDRIAW